MDIGEIGNIFSLGNVFDSSIKVIGILGTIVYFIYTIVLIKQIKTMKETVLVKDGGLLQLLGYAQVIVAILLILYSFFL
jgi:hypothetical protein